MTALRPADIDAYLTARQRRQSIALVFGPDCRLLRERGGGAVASPGYGPT